MHPAPSIILFTTFSGLGFGLLFWLGLSLPPVVGLQAFLVHALAFALAGGGLVASTFHLRHPERALLAFTQWRTSWLSREAVLSVTTLLVAGLFALSAILGAPLRQLGLLSAILCLCAVLATSMIYAQIRAVPRWNHWTTPVLFIALAITGGQMLAGWLRPAVPALLLCGALQLFAWHLADRRFAARGTNLSTATGLGGAPGERVRLFEPPHTNSGYLLREMAFAVGRRHRRRLRVLAILGMSLLPAALIWLLPGALAGLAAIALHVLGVLAARWLFFAEAEHVQALYYGRHGD